MIMINTAQQLRENIGDPRCDELINKWIEEIQNDFVKDDIKCVMEQVAPDGSIIDHIDGRTLNPGHAMEGAWFILHEAMHRNNDPRLIELGCKMIDYMWERGWDKEYGGLFYFRDVYGKPVQEYWQDMKFWWPHNEAIIATLMAYFIQMVMSYYLGQKYYPIPYNTNKFFLYIGASCLIFLVFSLVRIGLGYTIDVFNQPLLLFGNGLILLYLLLVFRNEKEMIRPKEVN